MPKSSMQRNQQAAHRPLSADSQSMRKDASAQTEDHVYGLVSVLYHALQGAETYEKYVDDAERAGDDSSYASSNSVETRKMSALHAPNSCWSNASTSGQAKARTTTTTAISDSCPPVEARGASASRACQRASRRRKRLPVAFRAWQSCAQDSARGSPALSSRSHSST